MADHLFRLGADELVDHLGHLLRGIRFLHGKREAHDEEEHDEAASHQQFHGKRVVNGRGGVGGMNAHGLHGGSHHGAE